MKKNWIEVLAAILLLAVTVYVGMRCEIADVSVTNESETGVSVTNESETDVLATNESETDEAITEEAVAAGGMTDEAIPDAQENTKVSVKGIYVTGPKAGSQSMDDLISLLDETELNTMVIDVKNDAGEITYQMDFDYAEEMGACTNYIKDMDGLMEKLKEHKIYTIARIVCFKDPVLAANHPEYALTKPGGVPVTDANGLAWVNPCEEGVWEYLTDVALQAAATGFDEIQYDYVRFPIGKDADAADYGISMEADTKKDIITGFLTYASDKLHEQNVVVTADVFGTIIGSDIDVERVGQDYTLLGKTVDVLSPMVYPSHYGNNVFGYPVPDAEPYGTVHAALSKSVEELATIDEGNRATVRPWLQAFTATWVDGHIPYGGKQIRDQIQAVYDAGYEQWILWNASNRYSPEGLLAE